MLKSILVALDGSPFSHAAVELGIRWARQFDALLVGMGIVEETISPAPALVAPGVTAIDYAGQQTHFDQELQREECRKVERYLERFALQCADAQVACKVLEDIGNPSERIERQAARFDLVLLGRRTFFNQGTTESIDTTLQQVIKSAVRPVVTVPNSIREGKGVLVAYDDSPSAARALQAFLATGLAPLQPIHVLTISGTKAEASSAAQRAADFLQWHGLQPLVHALATREAPAEVIEQEAWNLDPSLLVMGAFGHGRLSEALFGSVTRSLLKKSPVPLFLYR